MDGTIVTYIWNWGDSNANSNGITSSHTYTNSGTYTITLTVTDNFGAKTTSTKSITVTSPPVIVSNLPPVSKFTTTINNLAVTFVSTSTDSDGSIVSYLWNLGVNGVTNTNQQFTYNYPTAGTYTVTLTVTDNTGATSSSTQTVTVTQSTPPANQAPICSIGNVNINFLQLSVSSNSTDDNNNIVNYIW